MSEELEVTGAISGRLIAPADCPHDDECDCEGISLCPACGQPIDYCQGHGQMGDPYGYAVLASHDHDEHSRCHVLGCDWAHEYHEKHGHEQWEAPMLRCQHCQDAD